ncbi:EamA family transporter [Agrococcus sp. Marseille-P2731]|uniref:EamA family transporter n=1 Tax=Agrococcus sp. Marseille-P2731 TaxID=1841862 RepID=UPI000931056A|nr:EamA family transporter [Agrococcus sp. Marseille-P2731]
MTNRERLLGCLVAVLWGANFLAIHLSLEQFPPFFLVALRFALIAVPTILLVPRPDVPLRWLIGYGLGFGTLQFLFLYWAMASGMPTGLASLVLQASAPFTVLLGATLLRERLDRGQVAGIVLAAAGLTVIGAQQLGAAALGPFLLALLAALGWALGNLSSRLARPSKPLHMTLWMSVVPVLPMLATSLWVEGPGRIAQSFVGLELPQGLLAIAGLAYTILLGTVVGSGIWTWLLSRHPAARVAPFSMLVPVVGLLTAWLVLGETLTGIEIAGAAVVVLGVLLGSGALRQLRRRASIDPAAAADPTAVAAAPTR